MSTIPSSSHHASYTVHLDAQTAVEIELDLARPIYQVAGDLARQHGRDTAVDAYTFFAGADRLPLIRELPLGRTPYAEGGELYLAPTNAPWWISAIAPGGVEASPASRRPATLVGAVQAPSLRNTVLGGIVMITLGALIWLLWPGVHTTSAEVVQTAPPAPALAPPAIEPTATLLPAPTALPVPTTDPAMQASINYQNGLIAYDKQDWAEASALLQQVYDYNPNYLNIQDVLSASYYNWGVWARERGDIAGALEYSRAAVRVAPEHPLAPGEQENAQLYLEGQQAIQSGDYSTGLEKLRALIARQPGYADALQQLYGALVTQAEMLASGEAGSSLEAALALYREAAGLDVADRSAAEQGVVKTEALLPTPTPQPTAKPVAKKLRFSVINYNDDPRCISVGITGIVPAGWFFVVDGIGLTGRFDGGGNARTCGLNPGQEVTITVIDGNGTRVAGGGGVPSKGSAIMTAAWR